jgi:hypothetical protein
MNLRGDSVCFHLFFFILNVSYYIHISHSHSTFTFHIHIPHSHSTFTFHIHIPHSTFTFHIHIPHSHSHSHSHSTFTFHIQKKTQNKPIKCFSIKSQYFCANEYSVFLTKMNFNSIFLKKITKPLSDKRNLTTDDFKANNG